MSDHGFWKSIVSTEFGPSKFFPFFQGNRRSRTRLRRRRNAARDQRWRTFGRHWFGRPYRESDRGSKNLHLEGVEISGYVGTKFWFPYTYDTTYVFMSCLCASNIQYWIRFRALPMDDHASEEGSPLPTQLGLVARLSCRRQLTRSHRQASGSDVHHTFRHEFEHVAPTGELEGPAESAPAGDPPVVSAIERAYENAPVTTVLEAWYDLPGRGLSVQHQ